MQYSESAQPVAPLPAASFTRGAFRTLALLSALLVTLAAVETLEEALAGARALRLAEDREWLTLLHVERSWWGRRRSLVDDPAFFLHPDGKYDPTAELEATLAALWQPPVTGQAPAMDRFPARAEFLIRRLGIERSRLPVPHCQAFEEAYAALGPRSAFLAFPTAYMNTPASMFGHTLLVIRSRIGTGMAGQAINYAASTGSDGGIAFALKGVFGGYPGYYALLPYWQKIGEYRDIDQRDIWEYELALTPDEIRRLLLHVWELRGIASDYYFFDENCAYYLLYLIDVARPDLALHERTPPWVIPLDTVRLCADAGLIVDAQCRPSLVSQLRARAMRMTPPQVERALAIARGELPPQAAGADEPAAAVAELDLAADYLQALRNRRKVALDDYQPRFVGILRERARHPEAAPPPALDPGTPPHLGHGSLRLGLGGGVAAGQGFIELSARPAYHELLDPPAGFVAGAQIEFASLALRWYQDAERPALERLDAVTLRSFTPRDRFFAPPSWSVDSGLARERVGDPARARHHAFLDFGVGGCWSLAEGAQLYALLHADARAVDADPSLALGLGPELGGFVHWGRLTLLPAARWQSYVGDLPADNLRLSLRASVALHPDLAVGAELQRQRSWDAWHTGATLRVLAYF